MFGSKVQKNGGCTMIAAQTEQADEKLSQEVNEAGGTLHLGMGMLVVVTARIGCDQLHDFVGLIKDRYRDRARRTGRPYSKGKLNTICGQLPRYHLELGYDNLIISRTAVGWDVCFTTVERQVDALILQRLVREKLSGATVTVLSAGVPLA
jgi:hypothetical protein